MLRLFYNEIKRGLVDHTDSELRTVYVYNAEKAQHEADFENTAKGALLKIGRDKVLCEAIRHLIIDMHYSPYAVKSYFDNNGWPTETRVCEKTIYNYIYEGIIDGVMKEDLPNKGVKYREKGSTRRYSKVFFLAGDVAVC